MAASRPGPEPIRDPRYLVYYLCIVSIPVRFMSWSFRLDFTLGCFVPSQSVPRLKRVIGRRTEAPS